MGGGVLAGCVSENVISIAQSPGFARFVKSVDPFTVRMLKRARIKSLWR